MKTPDYDALQKKANQVGTGGSWGMAIGKNSHFIQRPHPLVRLHMIQEYQNIQELFGLFKGISSLPVCHRAISVGGFCCRRAIILSYLVAPCGPPMMAPPFPKAPHTLPTWHGKQVRTSIMSHPGPATMWIERLYS